MTVCSKHNVELQPEAEWKGRLLVCPVRGCDVSQTFTPSSSRGSGLPTTEIRRQPKLPGLDPGRQYRTLRVSEAALIKQWTQWGALKGYTVLEIGQDIHYLTCPCCRGRIKRITCPLCQETTAYSLFSQSTTGAPDTFWTHPSWGHNVWRGLEGKKDANAPIRVEQARLAALGYVDVVWTLEMVQAVLRAR